MTQGSSVEPRAGGAEPEGTGARPLIEVRDLRKQYGSRAEPRQAVHGVSFDVYAGELVSILGPNEAGKTTILKCLCGLIYPDGGSVRVNGAEITRSPRSANRVMTMVLEGTRSLFLRLTVRENLEFAVGLQGWSRARHRTRVGEAMAELGLESRADCVVQTLSRGVQQRVSIACALVKNRAIILMDEPTLGLDIEGARETRRLLRRLALEHERTILVSSHDLSLVEEVSGRALVIGQGRLLRDSTISALQQMFQTREVAFELIGALDPESEKRLRERFPDLRISTSESCALEVPLKGRDDFFDLATLIRRSGCSVHAVRSMEPTLEDIVLRLVSG